MFCWLANELILRFILNKCSLVTSGATSTPRFTRKLNDTRFIRRAKGFRACPKEGLGATKANSVCRSFAGTPRTANFARHRGLPPDTHAHRQINSSQVIEFARIGPALGSGALPEIASVLAVFSKKRPKRWLDCFGPNSVSFLFWMKQIRHDLF